jgi:hypothetical protein
LLCNSHGGKIDWRRENGGGDVGTGESIGDDILFARNVANVSREF